MDINPQEVINNLSNQIGALTTENVMLKMALAQLQGEMDVLRPPMVVPEEDGPAKKK